jgi:hypothetical protein
MKNCAATMADDLLYDAKRPGGNTIRYQPSAKDAA